MKYLERTIDAELIRWKESPILKPLLVRGARQVGKSWSIRNLGKRFKHYIEANLETQPELKEIFTANSDINIITAKISQYFATPVIPGDTLIFIDEIQACPEAIRSLWKFKELIPNLHVAAAGSLLEFTLKNLSSFGVGRIRSLFMYPLSFREFLLALGKGAWNEVIENAGPDNPLSEAMHADLVELFRLFILIGGMPASVAAWVETSDIRECREQFDDILQSYYDDFAKYSPQIDPLLLRNTLQSVVAQIGKKFVYARVEGGFTLKEIKEALSMLSDAGLIKTVRHTAANGIPLGAEVNLKFTKYVYLDSGLLLRMLDLELGDDDSISREIIISKASELINRGSLAEMIAGLEIVKTKSPKSIPELFYWENLADGATAEIDYIVASRMTILPIEIKSGTSGKMKSLRLFMEKKHLQRGIRSSLENFGRLTVKTPASPNPLEIAIIPLYAIGNIFHRDS